MHAFDYVAAQTVQEAVSLLAEKGDAARVLAGGTDLIVQVREGRRSPDLIVDVKTIPDTNVLSYNPQSGLTIGAAVPCYRIYGDAAIAAAYPGLVDAFSLVGGTQIQGRASVGGNLCNSSPAADTTPALMAHSAVAVIAGPGGTREVAVEDFCTGPGQNVLQNGEFLVSLTIPAPPAGFGACYLRFIPRNEMDIAVVGVGSSVVLSADGSTITSARVALGAVGPTPITVDTSAIAGQPANDATINTAAEAATAAARPISDMRGTVEQRRHLAGVLTRRTLQQAIARA
ncbi:MAG: carbon-monoxide dehydrogenase [Candidatus Entotheonella gemina]|uniref:Carbon-monoxide dehydrogenase n=1 Tax=Candidatus Entotheonella gemina TaxID=1429439 RepID=W4MGZ1_9BACT|nr:MAG: carbon-monoxide dehydrogenase [Candidatus Entotheonella gemina]